MFTDEPRRSVWEQIRQQNLRAFASLLTPAVLTQAASMAGVAMGRGPLGLATVAWLAIASALHSSRNFGDVLVMTLKLLRDADAFGRRGPVPRKGRGKGKGNKHDPRPQDPDSLSEEAFVQARSKAPAGYWMSLILVLGEKFRAQHAALLNWRGHRLLALDGTSLRLNNWKALKEHFGTAANGKPGRTTQARMVMLTFPLVRMPWKYRLCPLKCSERTCAAELLKGLGCGDLVLMDKGFWSYGLFWQIAAQQGFFAIRQFAKARLKTVRQLGPGDRLVRYSPADRKWKHLPRSMRLRLIRYRVPGFRATALVTNQIDRRITPRQWVGLATRSPAGIALDGGVYHRRWEIETSFCELKVRQKLEGSLRSRTVAGIEYEMAGHVLLYLLVRWLIVEAAVKHGLAPLRLSYQGAINELLDIAPALLLADSPRAARVLVRLLLARIAARVVPSRPGRHYPRPNDTKIKNQGHGRYRWPSKLRNVKLSAIGHSRTYMKEFFRHDFTADRRTTEREIWGADSPGIAE
jgi:hypothetical protein